MTQVSPALNILILSQHAGGDAYGMVHRTSAFAKQWQQMGHQVTIMSAAYSHTRHTQPDCPKRITLEQQDGIQYIWLKGNTYTPGSQLGRVISMALFNVQAWLSGARQGQYSPHHSGQTYDIVIASAPTPFCIFPAYRIALKNRARLIFEVRDLWPKTLIELGNISPKHPFIRLMQYAEDFACRHADGVIGVSANAKNYLISRGMQDDKFTCIPNGSLISNASDKALPATHQQALQQLRQRHPKIIGYCGAIGLANGLHVLIQALKQSQTDTALAIMGQGEYLSELTALIQQLGLQHRVCLLPAVPREQVPDFLHRVDITYLGLIQSGTFTQGVSPTKLADYMSAAKPVIYAIGDHDNAIRQSGAGIECQPGNTQAIATAIEQLSSYPDHQLKQLGVMGQQWMQQHLNLESLAENAIHHFYQRLAVTDSPEQRDQS